MYRLIFVAVMQFAILPGFILADIVRIPDIDVPANGTVVSFEIDRNWLPTDTLVISANGFTCTLLGCEVQLNAAAIIAVDLDTPVKVGQLDSQVYSYAEGAHQGGLTLSNQPFLDGDRPWIQLFRPTSENGLGANVVPPIVHSSRTLGDYGGFLAEPITAGTTLYLATADFNHGDNSGVYRVTSSVPEPGSAFLVFVATLTLAFRRQAFDHAR